MTSGVSGVHPPSLTLSMPPRATAPLQNVETARCKYAE